MPTQRDRASDTASPDGLVNALTIGAYGWTEDAYFKALSTAGVAVFCDVRRRRGVRGSEYAYVNSVRLQRRLDELGITYIHRLDLAPSTEVRRAQEAADAAAGVRKRDRTQLGAAFIRAYADEVLDGFDAVRFLSEYATDGPVALF